MYGQGNYVPRFGQGSQTPTPPFQQRPMNPHFQQGPPSVTPPVNYSSPFQYQHHPPPPGQHGLPVRVPTNGVPNTPQPYLPPPPGQHGPQVHVSNSAPHPYPTTQQNTQWAHNTQRTLPTPPPPGPYRQEMYQPPVPYRASTHTPHPTNQHLPPPPPLPTSSFVVFPPMFSMAPTPPPLPPSSPPPIPPSPPPTRSLSSLGDVMSTALHTASDSSDKIVATTENMDDTNTADDNKHLADTTSAKVGSPALESLSSREGAELDLSLPPPKPAEEKVVRKIEVLCRFIAKNGPSFEYMTRQKESANQEFGFLFGGEPGSEAAVAHEYFKWVKMKCLLQHKQSNSAVRLPEAATSKQPTPLDADASPSLSDMEMEDDFTQFDGPRCETVFKSEEHVDQEQLAIGSTLSLHNELPMDGDAFSMVSSFNASPTGAAKFVENIHLGVSSSSPHEDNNTIMKPAGELIKGASPFRLLQDYASDDSSEHDDKPLVQDAVPVTVPPSTTANITILSRDTLSSSLRDSDPKIFPSLELSSGEPSESGRADMCQSNPPNDQEFLPKLHIVAEEASTGTVKAEVEIEHQESTEIVVSPENVRRKDVLDVVHGSTSDKRKPQHQIEDVHRTSTLQKVDEFGRLVKEAASDSDPDESHRTRRHGKRSRSRSPNDRRRSRQSPRRRREKRSWSRSLSPRRRRSRSPSHRLAVESGGERVRREKGRPPDCFDFLRGRCHRGESCRYMHRETDKSAGARYNRNTTSDFHKEVEKMPLEKSLNEHDLYGSREEVLVPEQGVLRSAVSDQYDKTLVAGVCKSEKSSETTAMVLRSPDMKEEIFKSTTKLPVEHGGEKEESENSVLEKSEAKNQIGVNEPDFNKNASIISNQGDQLKPPAPSTSLPHGTGLPPPHLSMERVQPPMNYPYQAQFQMQPPHYPMPPNTWPASFPPPPPLQPQFTSSFSAATVIQGVPPPPPFQQNQFPPRNDYRMFPHNSHPVATTMDNNVRQTYGGQLSSFPLPSLGSSETNSIQSYPANSFPPSSQSNTYSVQPQYGLSQPSSDGLRSGDYGNINTPFRGSKFSLHYNPYASTFDQPFDSKIDSNVLNQGKDLRYDNPQAVISSLKISQAAELPMSGNNQYDPLFDCIEPSSNSFKKSDQLQALKSTLMLSSSREPLDVGEKYKQKEAQTAAISTSMKSNDEFGETADAEVGEVESGKSSNPQDGGHVEVEEVEIDQVKGKKSKDSRSMKLFKSSLADYVKEVLKPHWRQGGMSKEAFKIIVKKTIDKVCGAMKSHHIPKSQEKINRYIDSSERKLNKLVMGYVDKYAKI